MAPGTARHLAPAGPHQLCSRSRQGPSTRGHGGARHVPGTRALTHVHGCPQTPPCSHPPCALPHTPTTRECPRLCSHALREGACTPDPCMPGLTRPSHLHTTHTHTHVHPSHTRLRLRWRRGEKHAAVAVQRKGRETRSGGFHRCPEKCSSRPRGQRPDLGQGPRNASRTASGGSWGGATASRRGGRLCAGPAEGRSPRLGPAHGRPARLALRGRPPAPRHRGHSADVRGGEAGARPAWTAPRSGEGAPGRRQHASASRGGPPNPAGPGAAA